MENPTQKDEALTRKRPTDWVVTTQSFTPRERLERARERLRGAVEDLAALEGELPRLREAGWALDAMVRCVYSQLTAEHWDVAVKMAEDAEVGDESTPEDLLSRACRELAGATATAPQAEQG